MPDKKKYIKVITKEQTICENKKELEKDANYEVLGINSIQKAGQLAREGRAEEAQRNQAAWNKRMANNVNNEM